MNGKKERKKDIMKHEFEELINDTVSGEDYGKGDCKNE